MEASARRTWGGLEKLFLLRIIFPWLPLANNRLALAFTRLINAKKTSFPQASCLWEKWYPMITCQTSNSTAKPLTNNFNFSVFFFYRSILQAGDVPFAVKTSSELLTEESYVYVNTVIILGASLGVFTLCGLLWHYCFYKRTLSPKSSESGIRWWNYTDFILRDLFCRNTRKDYSPSIAPQVSWNLQCHNIFYPLVPHFREVNMIASVFHWHLEIWKAVCHFKLSLLLTKRRCSCTFAPPSPLPIFYLRWHVTSCEVKNQCPRQDWSEPLKPESQKPSLERKLARWVLLSIKKLKHTACSLC